MSEKINLIQQETNQLNMITNRYRVILLTILLVGGCDQNEYVINKGETGLMISEGLTGPLGKEGKWIYYDDNEDTLNVKYFEADKLVSEIVYEKGKISRWVEYRNELVQEAVIYGQNGNIESYSRSLDELDKGFTISFFEDGQINSFNFYQISNGSEKLLPNQKLTGSFTQYHKNGHIYAQADNIGRSIFNIYDTTGLLIYRVDYAAKDTLYKIANHRDYYIPLY